MDRTNTPDAGSDDTLDAAGADASEDASTRSTLSRRGVLQASLVGLGVSGTAAATAAAATDPVSVRTVTVDNEWRSVATSRSFSKPVALALPISAHGGHEASPRIRNVTGSGFDCRVEEWLYRDGWHTQETVGSLVVEAGVRELADGTRMQAGWFPADHRGARLFFAQSFNRRPVFLSQTQTANGGQPVVTRNRNLSTSMVEVFVQEEEAEGPHNEERVGYLAIEPGTGTLAGRAFEAGTVDGVTSDWTTIEFSGSYQEPVLLADLQTARGWNTCTLRHRDLTASSVDVFVEEGLSADDETWHKAETVGYLVVEGATGDTAAGYGAGGFGAGGFGA